MSSRSPRETRYRGVAFRSRLEAEYAIHVDRHFDYEWEYEPCRYMNGDGVTYLPDFRIITDTGSRFYVEIKPDNANFDDALDLMHVILDEETDVELYVVTATWRNGSDSGYQRWRTVKECHKDDPCGSRDCPRCPKCTTVLPPAKPAPSGSAPNGAQQARDALAASFGRDQWRREEQADEAQRLREQRRLQAELKRVCELTSRLFYMLGNIEAAQGSRLESAIKDPSFTASCGVNPNVNSVEDLDDTELAALICNEKKWLIAWGVDADAEDPFANHSVCPSCDESFSSNREPDPHLCDSCWRDIYELCWTCMEQAVDRDRVDADPVCEACADRWMTAS